MTGMDDEAHHRIDLNSSAPSPSSSKQSGGSGDLSPPQSMPVPNQLYGCRRCSVRLGFAAFALNSIYTVLSIVADTWNRACIFSFVWVCGPITGLVFLGNK